MIYPGKYCEMFSNSTNQFNITISTRAKMLKYLLISLQELKT